MMIEQDKPRIGCFRNPKTGDVLENIRDAYGAFDCKGVDCDECVLGASRCNGYWVEANPAEAARLMELEVAEDEKLKGENEKMELKNTIEMMNSEDYKERFKAEYWQTKIRYEKLHKMCIKYEAGTLTFTPSCSLELLREQKGYMGNYLRTLEIRAEIEGICLDS